MVTHCRHKSGGIKTVELALGWTPAKGVRGIRFSLGQLYDRSLISSSYPWGTAQANDYQSCTSYPVLHQRLDPAPATTVRQRQLSTVRYSDFAIRENLAFRSNHLVLLFLPSSLSIPYISKVCGIGIFFGPTTYVSAFHLSFYLLSVSVSMDLAKADWATV